MLENVLKRLCPCYFSQKKDRDLNGCKKTENNDFDVNPESRSNDKSLNSQSNTKSETNTETVEDTWKGTLNIVQPQPVYAFPVDSKKPLKRNQKTLLEPPLYWKKTKKNLCSDGPPVFQYSTKKKKISSSEVKKEKKGSKAPLLKHSGTVADISSLTSASTADVKWLKSQSLTNLSFCKSLAGYKNAFSISNQRNEVPRKYTPKYKNCMKCQVLPDISHGVILFTASYFNNKKVCLININRLENLSKKGREENSYCTVIKLAVLPSEKYIKCSKVLNSSSNPDVKQDFSFTVKDLVGKVLRFSVFDASIQKQHEAIGHALLTLENIICEQPKKYRIKLYRSTQPHICPGNLALSLKYSSEEDKFTIVIEKGKNLSLQRDKNVKLNTYVKATMYVYGEKVKTKKSIVVVDCRNPNYNSTFTFQVRNDQIDHLSVAIAVRLKGFVNDLTIGRLNFGPFFYVDNQKLTTWGRVFIKREMVCHWFRMYL